MDILVIGAPLCSWLPCGLVSEPLRLRQQVQTSCPSWPSTILSFYQKEVVREEAGGSWGTALHRGCYRCWGWGHRHRVRQDVSIQTPQFPKNHRSMTRRGHTPSWRQSWDGDCGHWTPSPVLLASPSGPVCASELCVSLRQGRPSPSWRQGRGWLRNP